MILSEFNALPADPLPLAPGQAERLLKAARDYRDMASRAYASMSGADVAGAPLYDYTADALGCLAQGKDLVATIVLFDAKWRKYAVENNAKVDAAPKTSRGPMSGHSVIHYRWTDPERFEATARFLRQMVEARP